MRWLGRNLFVNRKTLGLCLLLAGALLLIIFVPLWIWAGLIGVALAVLGALMLVGC